MNRFGLLIIAFCVLVPATTSDEWGDDLASKTMLSPIKADIVLAIDTAFYGWGDRSESDVFVDALLPLLRYFVETVWNTSAGSRIRVAVVEMAKNTSVLVELTEGTNPKAVIDTFNEKKDRRLSLEDRKSTTHIYRMLHLVNTSVCNRNDPTNFCMLIVISVAPAPVRVPFVGADWPSWRKLGDTMIRSAFDLGVNIMVLTTGYHESSGGKKAGLSEMARVEARLMRDPSKGEDAKPDWALTHWQAGYNREKSVDERVARRTVAIMRQLLAAPPDEKPIKPPPEQKPEPEEEEEEKEEPEPEDETRYEGLVTLIISSFVGTILGFSVKQVWRLTFGAGDVCLVRKFGLVLLMNIGFILFVLVATWVYGVLAAKYAWL